MVYYIDSTAPSGGDGSAAFPLRSHTGLVLLPGDTVLFRRGTSYREGIVSPCGEASKPISYGAFGKGPRPRFFGSVNRSCADDWENIGGNIWSLCNMPQTEVCNIIFGFSTAVPSCGILSWADTLDTPGKWFYSAYGCMDNPPDDARLLLYSEANPSQYYGDIELAVYGQRHLATGKKHVRFDGLAFVCSGVHGYAETTPEDVYLTNCSFDYIGGCVWNKNAKIRYGNAVELWNGARDITVSGCSFYEIYDSCFTTQGNGTKCSDFIHISVINCIFRNYGMAAYELRDIIGKDIAFCNNTCEGAGAGFSLQGETPPRRSEIWPEPMGHHIFAWRIDKPTDGGQVRIFRNRFLGKPLGAEKYLRISAEAAAQIIFS